MANDIQPMQVIKPIVFSTFGFSRASEATYYDASGILQTADVDVVRDNCYNPTTLAFIGTVLEPAGSNKFPDSNDFTIGGGHWALSGTASTTANTTTSPDGTSNAWTFNPTSSGEIYSVITTGSGWGIFSIYVKATAAGLCSLRLNLGVSGAIATSVFRIDLGSAGTGFEPNTTCQDLPNDWHRISIAGNFSASSNRCTIEGISGVDFYVYGAMYEPITTAGVYTPTSYIESVGGITTRAADVTSNPPAVLSSNILEDDHADYDGGTTYAIGDEVMVRGNYHRNYKSLVGSNTGQFPPDNPTKWQDTGATNRWRMFDMKVGADLVSNNLGTIDFTVSVASIVNSVGLFNFDAKNVRIRMYSGTDTVYDRTFDTAPISNAPSWHAFWFGKPKYIKNLVVTDLPPYSISTIQITLTGYSDDYQVELGKVVIGAGVTLGFTEYGSSVGIRDYSTKEPDTFGNYYILERRFTKRAELKVVVDPNREDFVVDTLADLRATVSCFIGHKGYTSLIILGFPEDFSVLFSTPASSYLSLTITGI